MSIDSSVGREQQNSWEKPTVDENRCDSVDLTSKLKAVAKNCRELAERFEQKKNKELRLRNNEEKIPQSPEFEKITTALTVENDALSEGIDRRPDNFCKQKSSDSVEETISSLKAGNLKLRQICKHISAINKRWQAYNKEVQRYIRRLEDIVEENKKTSNDKSPASQEQRDTTTDIPERDLILARYESLLDSMSLLQKELLQSKQNEDFLREQLEELALESQEQIKLLHYQLEGYKEDYETEKKERQVTQATSFELSKELNLIKTKLREYQRRMRRMDEFSHSSTSKTFLGSSALPEFTLIKGAANFCHLASDGDSENSVNSTASKSAVSDDEEFSGKCNFYECPGCKISLRSEKDYLEHYEECESNETA